MLLNQVVYAIPEAQFSFFYAPSMLRWIYNVIQQKLLIHKEFEKAKLTSGNRCWKCCSLWTPTPISCLTVCRHHWHRRHWIKLYWDHNRQIPQRIHAFNEGNVSKAEVYLSPGKPCVTLSNSRQPSVSFVMMICCLWESGSSSLRPSVDWALTYFVLLTNKRLAKMADYAKRWTSTTFSTSICFWYGPDWSNATPTNSRGRGVSAGVWCWGKNLPCQP